MKKVFTGIALASLLVGGQAYAQEVTTPSSPPAVVAPAAEQSFRAPTLGLTGLGDAGPVLLTGLLGAAVIGGILLLGDDDDGTTATNGTTNDE